MSDLFLIPRPTRQEPKILKQRKIQSANRMRSRLLRNSSVGQREKWFSRASALLVQSDLLKGLQSPNFCPAPVTALVSNPAFRPDSFFDMTRAPVASHTRVPEIKPRRQSARPQTNQRLSSDFLLKQFKRPTSSTAT